MLFCIDNFLKLYMNKIIRTLILLATTTVYAQVGINTETPSQTLDVNGTTRVRTLIDGASTTAFPYYVVAQEDGTLGKINVAQQTEQHRDDKLKISFAHTPTGLAWNSANSATATAQTAPPYYLLFGRKFSNLEITLTTARNINETRFTSNATTFSAKEGDFITFSYAFRANIYKNFENANRVYNELDTVSDKERKVRIYFFLYKGDTVVDKTIYDIGFYGKDDLLKHPTRDIKTYLSRNVLYTYKIPTGGAGNDYSISIIVTTSAPNNGLFRVDIGEYEQALNIYAL